MKTYVVAGTWNQACMWAQRRGVSRRDLVWIHCKENYLGVQVSTIYVIGTHPPNFDWMFFDEYCRMRNIEIIPDVV